MNDTIEQGYRDRGEGGGALTVTLDQVQTTAIFLAVDPNIKIG